MYNRANKEGILGFTLFREFIINVGRLLIMLLAIVVYLQTASITLTFVSMFILGGFATLAHNYIVYEE